MRHFLPLAVFLLASCAAPEPLPPDDRTPFDQRLAQFAALQNAGKFDALRTHFTKTAKIQSPVTPQSATVDRYLRALAVEPFMITFSGTVTVYAFPDRAVTRSQMRASAPGQFQLTEQATIEWKREDGYWRMARVSLANWPAIIGTWRRSGLRMEGSIELRVLPDGSYVVYTAEDYSAPAFRGRYRLEGNKIFLADTSAWEARQYQGGEGSYLFVRTPTGVTFRRVDEANTWRAERFEGAWTAAH